MIRQLGAGAYSYLPLGFRTLHKAINIVRQEMDAAGAQELLMPAIHPAELWAESGRLKRMGGILMELKLGGGHDYVLGPTHEEVVTDIARDLINSYKQLPITLYQIQTKFRDEPRPRFGILRTREFIMKDAYSFGTDLAQLNTAYAAMYEAYCRIFDRCGLPYVIVEAESGPIGGDSSHEFMVPCSIGEDTVIQCKACGYAANRERAEIGKCEANSGAAPVEPFRRVETPNKRTIEELSKFLKVNANATAKLLVFQADGKTVAVMVRGDHEANEAKVRRHFGATALEAADANKIREATGAPMGFLGPVGIKIPLVVDPAVAAMSSVVVGGNETDIHLTGVVPGRDFALDRVADVRNAETGDPCPRCGASMEVAQGIEIGHVFKLGTKYSHAMGANYLDAEGKTHPLIMGCYGIGANRILAAAVETSSDKDGIIWPLEIAPYEVVITPLQVNNPTVMEHVDAIERALVAAGHDVLVDDRDTRPGVKFKDADLIGIPLRLVVGERGLKEGQLEVKWRHVSAATNIPLAGAADAVNGLLAQAREVHERRVAERRAARAAAKS
jgi:prolyl-tRNA synthetase